MPYNHFTEMPVWQLTDEIVGDIYRLTEALPKREDYALCSQLRDAAVSITGNIAEGFEEDTKKIKSIFTYIQGAAVLKFKVICLAEKLLVISLISN